MTNKQMWNTNYVNYSFCLSRFQCSMCSTNCVHMYTIVYQKKKYFFQNMLKIDLIIKLFDTSNESKNESDLTVEFATKNYE